MNKDLIKCIISSYKLVNDKTMTIVTDDSVYDNVVVDDISNDAIFIDSINRIPDVYIDNIVGI